MLSLPLASPTLRFFSFTSRKRGLDSLPITSLCRGAPSFAVHHHQTPQKKGQEYSLKANREKIFLLLCHPILLYLVILHSSIFSNLIDILTS
jgi:hypothetical protein